MTVYLVGAGPGDPGLLTVRGAEVLARADVVVHDRLANASLLDLAPPGAERIDVGKRPGGPVDQASINDLLVERGGAGLEVVRLKGGDPFVFGRGGEEALALMDAGVAFEVVPGVTSAVAVPAYAGVPITHRGLSTSFTVLTGHSRHGDDQPTDWEALGRAGGTIVILMGVAHRDEFVPRLIAGGLSPDTPVVAVRWGTRPDQRSVRTTLARLPEVDLEPPVTIVVGRVAGLDVGWFDRRPLFGRTVVVTRARHQAPELVRRLEAAGAEVLVVPTIAVAGPSDGGAALDRAAARLHRYSWVVFTSTNAVERFLPRLRDARAFGSAHVAAIGPGTAEALARFGVVADLVPSRSNAEGLLEVFPDPPDGGGAVLLPRAAVARDALPDGLRARRWEVEVVEAYRTQPVTPPGSVLAEVAAADAVAFASGSSVTSFAAAAGAGCVPPVVVCIGPVTADAARRAGVPVTAVAARATLDALVDAVVAALRPVR
ncbi:MAG TPA: uroporphyrinogen-III C-methyltransferase [Acidimicrobiales bacterium]|nr:uroporphyrinogen-III C-methyltransferase [Acidimicrobiales bacterium]